MKIVNLLLLLVSALLALVIINGGIIYYFNNQMTSDSRVVNYAGIIRGATQRVIKLELAGDYSQADELIAELDQIISGLKNGDKNLNLPQASGDKFIAVINEVSDTWITLKQTLYQTRQDSDSRSRLVEESEDYFYLTNQAVGVAEEFSRNKVTNLKTVIIVSSIISLGIISAMWVVIRRKIFKPLINLAEILPKIAGGDLSQRLKVESNDEFGILASLFNITATKLQQSYEKIKEKTGELSVKVGELQKFQLAVENANEHVIITDADGNILYVNPAAERITGYSRRESIGARPSLWGNLMTKEFYANLWRIIRDEKKVFTGEITNRRKSGELYQAIVNISPILGAGGEVKFFVGLERDVTLERNIDKAKTEFVSLASHQLRTPLSAINWYTEMLLAGDAGKINAVQKRYLEEVYQGGQRMVGLVNVFLNVSRIELGTFVIEPEPVNLQEAAQIALKELRLIIREKKIKVTATYDAKLPSILLDPKLINIIFQNLLSNAVKYTPAEGAVSLEVSQDEKNAIIRVSDTGCGIPRNQQAKIFSKLFRADNAASQETEGTGLGLYIVKAIIDRLGGSIRFESEQDKGTTFFVTLPLAGMAKKEGIKTLE